VPRKPSGKLREIEVEISAIRVHSRRSWVKTLVAAFFLAFGGASQEHLAFYAYDIRETIKGTRAAELLAGDAGCNGIPAGSQGR